MGQLVRPGFVGIQRERAKQALLGPSARGFRTAANAEGQRGRDVVHIGGGQRAGELAGSDGGACRRREGDARVNSRISACCFGDGGGGCRAGEGGRVVDGGDLHTQADGACAQRASGAGRGGVERDSSGATGEAGAVGVVECEHCECAGHAALVKPWLEANFAGDGEHQTRCGRDGADVVPGGTAIGAVLPVAQRCLGVGGDDDAFERGAAVHVLEARGKQVGHGAADVVGRGHVLGDGAQRGAAHQRGPVVDGGHRHLHAHIAARHRALGIARHHREGGQRAIGVGGGRPHRVFAGGDEIVAADGPGRATNGQAAAVDLLDDKARDRARRVVGIQVRLVALGDQLGIGDSDRGVFAGGVHRLCKGGQLGGRVAFGHFTDRGCQRGRIGRKHIGKREGFGLPGDKIAQVKTHANGLVAVTNVGARQIGAGVGCPARDAGVVGEGAVGVQTNDTPTHRACRQDDVASTNTTATLDVVGRRGGTGQAIGVHVGVNATGVLDVVDGVGAGVGDGHLHRNHLGGLPQGVGLGDLQPAGGVALVGDGAIGVAPRGGEAG